MNLRDPVIRESDMTVTDTRHPSAWRPDDFASPDELSMDLTGRDIAILEDAIAPWRDGGGTVPDPVCREDVFLPGLEGTIDRLAAVLMEGRGVAIVRGFPVRDHDERTIALMYRAFCCRMGRLLSQSKRRERIGYVAHRPDRILDLRGYERAGRQVLHTDMEAVLGMLCVRRASEGGESRLASALAIHDEIRESRPDLLEPLLKGFPVGWGEEPPERPTNGYSDYDVPVLSWNDGRISVCHLPPQVREAAELAGTTLTGAAAESLDLFACMCEREDIVLTLALNDGEAYFINNYNTLHARNAFTDEPGESRGRLMLRAWLDMPQPYPISRGLRLYYDDLKSAYGENMPAGDVFLP